MNTNINNQKQKRFKNLKRKSLEEKYPELVNFFFQELYYK
jgi:hypothetical protein